MQFKNLMSQGQVGSLRLKNRIIMPAMGDALATVDGEITDDLIGYYEERAKGGTGLIITGVCRIDPDGAAIANQLAAYNLSHVGGLKKLADGVHRYDGRIFVQLHHGGRQTNTMVTGKQAVAPSPIPVPGGMPGIPRELTTEEVKEMVGKFVFGAVLAKMAGMDGVEVHCAHGYLLNQFISSFSNKRTDEYGGSLENRLRIVKEIIGGIKAKCGFNFPVSVRFTGDEFVQGGIQIEEAVEIARQMELFGADLLNVSGGGYQAPYGIMAPPTFKQGWMVPLAEAVKKAVNIPVGAVSLIRDFDYADQLVETGKCDFVCLGRPHIADPYLANKLASGREKEIRRCLSCLHCTDELNKSRLGCAVNPLIGYEREFKEYNFNGQGRTVVVIGGGPGGCEAARVLVKRGFQVTLFEKKDKLGGQVNLAAVPPAKEQINNLSEYYTYMLPRLGVDIKLNTEPTLDEIAQLRPYAVYLATGSEPVVPSITGIDCSTVTTADAVLSGTCKFKDQYLAIIGSGNTGLETAEYLLQFGNKISIIEMLPQVGMLASTSGKYTLGAIQKEGVELLASHKMTAVSEGKVELFDLISQTSLSREYDGVVLALGVKKVNALEELLKSEFENVVIVGDAYQVGNIASSVKSGFQKAYYLDNHVEMA